MILDQLFETAGQDNTIYQVSRAMLDNNPGRSYLRASDDDILRDAARELSRMGMSDVKVRAIMRDPDFAGELIDTLRGPLKNDQMREQGVAEGRDGRDEDEDEIDDDGMTMADRARRDGRGGDDEHQPETATQRRRRSLQATRDYNRGRRSDQMRESGMAEGSDFYDRFGHDVMAQDRKKSQPRLGDIKVKMPGRSPDTQPPKDKKPGVGEGIIGSFLKNRVRAGVTPKEVAISTIRQLNQKASDTKMGGHPDFSKFKQEVHDYVASAEDSMEAIRRASDDHVMSLGKKYFKESDVREAMKPSDIPPTMRDRLTMKDIERERPAGAFRFRVVTPQGDAIDFMDQSAAEQRARAMGGRVEPIDPQPQGLPGRNRFRVQDPQGSRPAATFQDRAAAERYAAAKRLPVEIIPEAQGKKAGARIARILQMLRARHPQAENDLEALIFDFRSQQSQDRSDIARLDAENDAEEADIQRLERMLDLIKRRRGAAAEPVQEDDIDDAMRDYLARGGKVQQEPAKMPRLSTRLRQHGSRHIGQGREPRAGQLSGRGANVAQGGKPVVTAESLRDGEYHVATVTLDDGTVKKVRITSDEGFRDQITKHFEKQGRQVKDIDVDYSVRSELDEAKKKPQPTNPELWSRAKSAARSKFDVYPSAYANAWAAKWYKSKGGGWRMGKPKKD